MRRAVIFLGMLAIFFIHAEHALCAPSSPEAHVKEFYDWYIMVSSNQEDPLDVDAIYQYVNPGVVQNIRIFYKRAYFDADYFTKSQDIWKEWRDALVVHEATEIDETTSIVPISFKWDEESQHHLIVFVQNEKGSWRIIKVVGTHSFFE